MLCFILKFSLKVWMTVDQFSFNSNKQNDQPTLWGKINIQNHYVQSSLRHTVSFLKFCQACFCDEKIGLVRLDLMAPLHQRLIWSCRCYIGQQKNAANLRFRVDGIFNSMWLKRLWGCEKIVCLFSVQRVAVLLTILYQLFSQYNFQKQKHG